MYVCSSHLCGSHGCLLALGCCPYCGASHGEAGDLVCHLETELVKNLEK